MPKVKDAAEHPEVGNGKPDSRNEVPDSRLRNLDLHRYRVVTMPVEAQQELASLPLPRLSDQEMPPPIDGLVRGQRGQHQPVEASSCPRRGPNERDDASNSGHSSMRKATKSRPQCVAAMRKGTLR